MFFLLKLIFIPDKLIQRYDSVGRFRFSENGFIFSLCGFRLNFCLLFCCAMFLMCSCTICLSFLFNGFRLKLSVKFPNWILYSLHIKHSWTLYEQYISFNLRLIGCRFYLCRLVYLIYCFLQISDLILRPFFEPLIKKRRKFKNLEKTRNKKIHKL